MPERKVLLFFLCGFFLGYATTAAAAASKGRGPCQAVSKAQAADILGVQQSDLLVQTFDDLPSRCVIRSKSNFLKSISFSVYHEGSAAEAKRDFDKMRQALGILSKIETVPGLGDAAFWAGNDRVKRLALIKDSVFIDIRSPRKRAQQEKIARILLSDIH